MPPTTDEEVGAPARRRGRIFALVVAYGLLAVFIVLASSDITRQLFGRPVAASTTPCATSLRLMVAALDNARDAAAVASERGEDAALEVFRGALGAPWRDTDGVERTCAGDARLRGGLDAIERLRYAEEHAVRREAAELAPLRRRVRALVEQGLD